MAVISRRLFLKGACVAVAALSAPRLLRPAGAASPFGFGADELPTPEVMNGILTRALARGGDYADLYIESSARTQIMLGGGEIQSIEYGVLKGGGVRTVIGERVGYAYAESFDPQLLGEAADTAAEIAAHGGPAIPVPISEITFPRYIQIQEPIEDAEIAAKAVLLRRVDRAARAVSPAVQQVIVKYNDSMQRFTVATSEGQLGRDELPLIYVSITVTATKDGRSAEGRYRASRRAGMEFLAGDLAERAGRAAAERAVRMLDAVPAPTGEMPVVIAAGGGVLFHEAVGHGLEADAVLRDASVFTGRVGQKVASERVTLYDDATIPGERGSFDIDDEGSPARKTLLIDRGTLVGFMEDRRTARITRTAPTGNGRRQSFRYPATVRMTNTNVAPGSESPEEIIRSTSRGIYAVNFGGGDADPGTGQVTFRLEEAYRIEDGRVTAPLRGAYLVGSGIEVLERIDRMGNDFATWPGTCGKGGQWTPVSCGCPTLRISRMTVGATI